MIRFVGTALLIAFACAAAASAQASTLTVIYHDAAGAGANNLGTPVPVAGGAVIGTSHVGGTGFGEVFLLTPGPTALSPWTKRVIHNFLGATDGMTPDNLMVDGAGNVWGLTAGGGKTGNGTVFELAKPRTEGGTWSYRLAVNLPVWLGGQATSRGYEAILDGAGNLYGLMHMGSYGAGCESAGCGLIFKVPLATLAGNSTLVRTLYTFSSASVANGGFGGWPQSLARDVAGNFYGVEYSGGNTFNPNTGYGPLGVVWQVSPPKTGSVWTGKVIYTFCEANYLSADCADGIGPAGVTVDPVLGLLGTTEYSGGATGNGNGVIFRLQNVGGTWTYTVLHTLEDLAPGGAHTADYAVRKPLGKPTRAKSGAIITLLDSGGLANLGTAGHPIFDPRGGGALLVNSHSGADVNLSNGFGVETGTLGGGISGPWEVNSPLTEGVAGTFYGASQNYFNKATHDISLPGVIYRITE